VNAVGRWFDSPGVRDFSEFTLNWIMSARITADALEKNCYTRVIHIEKRLRGSSDPP
jgi:hypothetical protein